MTQLISPKHIASAALLSLGALLLLAGCATPPPPPTPVASISGKVVKYTCTGNGHVTVTYGNGTATLPGPETLLADESGQRYAWPSDGTHHIWALAAGVGTLSLSDGSKGTVTVVQSGCKPDAA